MKAALVLLTLLALTSSAAVERDFCLRDTKWRGRTMDLEVSGADVQDVFRLISDVARIMPAMVAMYLFSGPLIMLGSYFQAIGDAGRAAILGLSKPYLFTMPLVALYASTFGEPGIWFATPTAEALLLAVAMLVLWQGRGNGPLPAGCVDEHTIDP